MATNAPNINEQQPCLNVAVIGHVNSGKSTTAGRFLCLSGAPLPNFEKWEKETNDTLSVDFKDSIKYAWILDKLKAERECGLTIETSYEHCITTQKALTIIDVPGHKDYIENMISGTSQADCALLVVSAATGEFEAGMAEDGQTKEHALLAITLGVRELIVAVSKMDQTEPPYSERRFVEIVDSVSDYIKTIGYNPKGVPFIPVSGFKRVNIFEQSHDTDWFRGWEITSRDGRQSSGKTLLEAIDFIEVPYKYSNKPLRISIRDTYKPEGDDTYFYGRVATGVIRANSRITFTPGSLTAEVKYLAFHNEGGYYAGRGQHVKFQVKNKSVEDVCAGYVVGETENDPPKVTKSFSARVMIVNHPGEIHVGYTPVVDCHTAHVACEFVELTEKLDRRTGRKLEDSPKFLKSGDTAIVKLVPTKPMCVESAREYPALGRFIMRDNNHVVALGVVNSTEKAKE